MPRTSPRLQQDVDMAEEIELQRLESGAPIVGDASGGSGSPLQDGGAATSVADEDSVATSGGLLEAAESNEKSSGGGNAVVQGAAQRREQLESKMFLNGGCRSSGTVAGLLPYGGAGLKTSVPKRKNFGKEGIEGDAAHVAAMKEFSVKEFGTTHVQGKSIDRRMANVGLFGYWREQNNYGKFVEWHVKQRKKKHAARMVKSSLARPPLISLARLPFSLLPSNLCRSEKSMT